MVDLDNPQGFADNLRRLDEYFAQNRTHIQVELKELVEKWAPDKEHVQQYVAELMESICERARKRSSQCPIQQELIGHWLSDIMWTENEKLAVGWCAYRDENIHSLLAHCNKYTHDKERASDLLQDILKYACQCIEANHFHIENPLHWLHHYISLRGINVGKKDPPVPGSGTKPVGEQKDQTQKDANADTISNKVTQRIVFVPLDNEELDQKENGEISTDEQIVDDETMEVFERMLGLLSPNKQEILTLYYIMGYKSDEIAKILGKKQESVESTLKRAVFKLRACYFQQFPALKRRWDQNISELITVEKEQEVMRLYILEGIEPPKIKLQLALSSVEVKQIIEKWYPLLRRTINE